MLLRRGAGQPEANTATGWDSRRRPEGGRSTRGRTSPGPQNLAKTEFRSEKRRSQSRRSVASDPGSSATRTSHRPAKPGFRSERPVPGGSTCWRTLAGFKLTTHALETLFLPPATELPGQMSAGLGTRASEAAENSGPRHAAGARGGWAGQSKVGKVGGVWAQTLLNRKGPFWNPSGGFGVLTGRVLV